MVRKWNFIVTGLIMSHAGLIAQGLPKDRPIYPEKLHEDLEVLRITLHEAHPDPYRFVSAAGLDRAFAQVQDAVAVPMAAAEFRDALLPVFHALGDPRCGAPPVPRTNGQANAAMIPLQVCVAEGAIYVDQELKGFRSLPPGARISSINGHSAGSIIQKLNAQVVAEGANTTLRHAIIGRDFPQLFHRYVDPAGTFLVRYTNGGGTEEEQRVAGLTQAEMNLSRQNQKRSALPWGHERILDGRAFWLTLRSLDKDTLAAAGQRPDRYLEGLLKELRTTKAEVLVVDVRGTNGRDLAMAETVFATFADMPFRAVKEMTTRSMAPPTHYGHAEPVPDHYAMLRTRFQDDGSGTASLKPTDASLQLAPPVKSPFTGKVYVVCDGLTRDAGAALVMLVKRNARGRVIGEEVGTNAASFTGGKDLRLSLPNSGVRVEVPLVRFVPDGEPAGAADHGEKPHYPLVQRPGDTARGRDTVRESVLQLLNELK